MKFPLWLRLTHWLNALAVTIMVSSGLAIYNGAPLFGFRFPGVIVLGKNFQWSLKWHFAFMWVLAVNASVYFCLSILTGRFRSIYFSIRAGNLWTRLGSAMRFEKSAADHGVVQRLAYLFVMVDIGLLVLSGLVLWKPVQFPLLRTALGDYDCARYIHFSGMIMLVGFFVLHVIQVSRHPEKLMAMFRGR